MHILSRARCTVAKLQVSVQTVQYVSTATASTYMYTCACRYVVTQQNLPELCTGKRGEAALSAAAVCEYTRRKLRFDGNITSLASTETERKAVGEKKSEMVRVSPPRGDESECTASWRTSSVKYSRAKSASVLRCSLTFSLVTECFTIAEGFAKYLHALIRLQQIIKLVRMFN